MTRAASLINYTDLLERPREGAPVRIEYGSEPDQFGELWVPGRKDTATLPVVVLIHGGCWLAALPGLELMDQLAGDLMQSGVAVWNLEYRRLGTKGAGYPGTFLDVAQGIDHLNKISADYNLDLSRVVIAGHSAGGHLALWAAGRKRISSSSALHTPQLLPIKAVVTLAGINDLRSYRDHGPGACGGPETIDRLVGAAQRTGEKDLYADTSPAALVPLGVSQLVVAGGFDGIVPPAFSDAYANAAKEAGDSAEFMLFPEAGHFELIDPRFEGWAVIKKWVLGVTGTP